MYLTQQQLSDLIDCAPTSYACMKRWLTRNNWPYVVGLSGQPKVSVAYHDARMGGSTSVPAVQQTEPNWGAFDELSPRQLRIIEKKRLAAQSNSTR